MIKNNRDYSFSPLEFAFLSLQPLQGRGEISALFDPAEHFTIFKPQHVSIGHSYLRKKSTIHAFVKFSSSVVPFLCYISKFLSSGKSSRAEEPGKH